MSNLLINLKSEQRKCICYEFPCSLNLNVNDTQPWSSNSSLYSVITEDELQACSKKKLTHGQ